METGETSLFEVHRVRPAACFVAGRVVALELFIPTEPYPAQRPRGRIFNHPGQKGYRKDGQTFIQWYPDKKSKEYQDHVAKSARSQLRDISITVCAGGDQNFTLPFVDCMVSASMTFYMHRPVSYPKRVTVNTRKPDLDNLSKGVLDGLVEGNILPDDNCVTELYLAKRYADATHPEGVLLDLTAVPVEVP